MLKLIVNPKLRKIPSLSGDRHCRHNLYGCLVSANDTNPIYFDLVLAFFISRGTQGWEMLV